MDVKDCLVIIDMQNDFIDGVLGSQAARNIVPLVLKKIRTYMENDKPVYATMDTHYKESFADCFESKLVPEHCIKGTHGWKLHPSIDCYDNIVRIRKSSFGCVEFREYLPYVKTMELCGLYTDICVVSNALIMRSRDKHAGIYVNGRCCAGTTYMNHMAALRVMKSCGIEVYGCEV